MVVPLVAWGYLLDRPGERIVLTVGSALTAAAAYAAAAVHSLMTVGASIPLITLALTDHLNSPFAVALMVAVSVIAVTDNGLEATAITEFAGAFWSGRALGTQNTTQRLTALAGPPMFGALINAAGYPLAFALCCLLPRGRAVCADRLAPTRVGAENTAGRRSPTPPVESHSVAQLARVANSLRRPSRPPGQPLPPRRRRRATVPPA
jgi:MFS family permease